MKISITLKAIASFAMLTFMIQTGFSQTVLIGGNQYAFQWTGDPDIGLYFSSANSRYEFRDLAGDAEMWCNPVTGITYFRNRVGVNKTNPSASIDARSMSTSEPSAIVGRGSNSPTNGYLGAQGDATNFDNISGLSLLPGGEIGVLGLSTGGGGTNDNYGVVGYSTYVGMNAQNPTSGYQTELATTTYAIDASGPSNLDGNVEVSGDLSTSGKVGIGTTTPSCKLDVVSVTTADGAAISGRGILGPTNGYMGVQGATDFDGITGFSMLGEEIGVLGVSLGGSSTDNSGLYGYSNGRGVYAEHSISGNSAAFGTSNFSAELNGSAQILGGVDASLTGYGYLTLGDTAGANMVIDNNEIIARNGAGVASTLFFQASGGNTVVGTATTFPEKMVIQSETGQSPLRVRVSGSTKFQVNSNGGTTIGTISSLSPANGLYVSGNVTIGTTTQATGYKVSVNGKMICEELTVQNSVSWPDYVFDADYEMPTLMELSNEIDELGHLPGIPSAEEVAEHGAPVGEMNRLLLEKVEEITLYMIDLQEQINVLTEENEVLKSELNK